MIEREGEDQNGARLGTTNGGIPRDAPPHGWDSGGIIYTAIFVPRDKFLSCKCDVPSRSRAAGEGNGDEGKI